MARKIIGGAITSMPHNENYKELYEKIDGAQSVINQARDATNKADEAATNANTAASNANTARSNALQAANIANQAAQNANTAIVNVENKMSDIENRWSNLTTAKQEDAEVIDARTSTAKGKTFNNINERFEEIEEEIVDATYTPELTNQSLIFGVGTGYDKNGNYIDLNDKVTKGQVSGIKIQGLTATNIIKNGDFEKGLEEWKGNLDNAVIENGMLKVNTSKPATIFQNLNIAANHKYYIAYNVVSDGVGVIAVELRQTTTTIGQSVLSGNSTTYTRRSGVVEADQSGDRLAIVRFSNVDADVKIDNILLIDLTVTFGEGNEPTKEECDKIFANWFDGTKSTIGAFRQKSVGKNIFDGEMINAFIDTETGQPVSRETSVCSKNFIPIIPGETYIFSQHSKGKHVNYFIYDAKRNYVRNIYATAGTSVTFADNEYYIKIGYSSGYQDVEELQIEKGSVVTSYEPYQESNIYVLAKDLETGEILKLRSLPNGTKDEVDIAREMLIKRVSDKVVIDGNMEWGAFTVIGADNDVYRMSVTAHYIKNKLPNSYNGGATYGYMVGINDIHTFETGQFTEAYGRPYKIAFNSTGDFFITIDKDYLDTTYGGTLNGFKSYLNDHPITLIYQLAKPVEMPITIEGHLESYPNGTVYFEPYLTKTYSYNNGIILDKPVTQIDKLMGFVNGDWKELNNVYNLLLDGLILTINGIENGEKIKVYAPIKLEESTTPQITHVAPTNQKATIYNTLALASRNSVRLDKHDSMLLGLALSYIDLDIRLKALEVQ